MQNESTALSTFKKWHIGDVTVTRVQEMATITMEVEWLFKDATSANVLRHRWLQPDFATEAGQLRVNIQAFIIEAGGKRIMVDPCIGNHKQRASPLFNMLDNPFIERLTAAGFPPESIDYVLCTHLHVDHCGWNTHLVDGRWVPTFVNARHLFARREFEYACSDKGPEQENTYNDSVRPIEEAGLVDLVDFHHHLLDEIWLEPTPGHTPGHCAIRIRSKGVEAVISGDLIHHPLQAAEPGVCSNYDYDGPMAIRTRHAFLDGCVEGSMLLLGTHFAEPTGVRVHRDGDHWVMEGA